MQPIEPVAGGRIDDERLVRAVVLNGGGEVAPVQRTDAVAILLQGPTCRGRWPRDGHRVRGRAEDGQHWHKRFMPNPLPSGDQLLPFHLAM